MKRFMESERYLKLNEKLKIKDKIINFLENELADLKVSNFQSKKENNNKIKLQTIKNESKIFNNLINENYQGQQIQNHDKLLPKAQTPKKQSQLFLQGQKIDKQLPQEKQKFNWIAQLNEKNKKIATSIASLQGTNQSFNNSNCSLTESLNPNFQTNSNRNILE
ncbi:unnamed protein product [Paramecium sonneborni]|uniref:Uncharacterized protein n=1 Tax=Paramecium sonneborni TaxID=65129 RepID=A0A8S1PV77_9CILI|nr:unnamed protein product [Paramecium sonneborni]